MRAADSQPGELRTIVARPARWNNRPCGDRPFALSTGNEAARRGKFSKRLGRHCKPVRSLAGDAHGSQQTRICAERYCALDGGGTSETGWLRNAQRPNRSGIRCGRGGLRSGERVRRERRSIALPPHGFAVPGTKAARCGEGYLSSRQAGVQGRRVSGGTQRQGAPRWREERFTNRMTKERIVGTSVPRLEGRDKVTGQARYVDDMVLPGMIYGATVRSRIARGKIERIAFGTGIDWNTFVIVGPRDIPGKNCIALIEDDQPCLADGMVNHPEEALLLLAHADRHLVPKAVEAISVEYHPLPAIFTMEESEAQSQIIWGRDNTFKSYRIEKGDVDAVWQSADHIVEGEYTTGAQEQLYIENNGMIAAFDPHKGLTVWGSLQCPYYVHKALMKLFGLSADRVRVVQMETGGAFGGKEEYPSMIAAHAALLAMKAGKPVKIIYDRMEDMAATTKRHPSRTHHRTAVSRDGKILGGEIDFTIDGGAYATLSSVVLSRGVIHAGGPYYWPSIRIRAKAVATNMPPHGAFRGFGAPQSLFAMERHMDRIAQTVGLSPVEIRRRNFLQPEQATTTEQVVREPIDLGKLLDRALEISDYHSKKQNFAKQNLGGPFRRGMGIAAFLHGAGFTGSGERYLSSVVGVEGCADGSVRVLVSSTEFGQGTNTVLSQIAAEALHLPYENVSMAPPDTLEVPNSGPTVASRTAMVVGKLVQSAAVGIAQTLIE